MTAAWTALRALRREDALVSQYPAACRLVRDLDPAERAKAGQLLSTVDTVALAAAHPEVPRVGVFVTGNGTTAPLTAPLTAELAARGMALVDRGAHFGSWFTDLMDPVTADLTVCLLDPGLVTAELGAVWDIGVCREVLDLLAARVSAAVREFDSRGSGTLVLTTVPLPRWLSRQLLDHASRAELGILWRAFNTALLELARLRRVVVIDVETCVGGGVPVDDPQLRAYAGLGLSEPLLDQLAAEIAGVAQASRGRSAKCLVVDLDNTLWGGVLGDDGVAGIEVGGDGRGGAFAEFQRVIGRLAAQGVLVGVCSKNDASLVAEAFAEHPGMVLRDKDFVDIRANWEVKSVNLAELVDGLGIGLDSVVFADDSAFECGLVRDGLPEVKVILLDADPATHVRKLLEADHFVTLRLTDADRARGGDYQAKARREAAISVEGYLAGLGTRVTLGVMRPEELARVAQLTQRTNQFNLTTLRMTEADVESYGGSVLCVRVADRFGDSGLVGALFVKRTSGSLTIENMMLSCRVFSRGIEDAVIGEILRQAADRGLTGVSGLYKATTKNRRFEDFWTRSGFDGVPAEGEVRHYRHHLARLPSRISHIDLESTAGEAL